MRRRSFFVLTAAVAAAMVGGTAVGIPGTATIEGRVTGTDGTPIEGVCAEAIGGSDAGFAWTPSTATTDASGRYTINVLVPWTYTVLFSDCASSRPGPSRYKARWYGGASAEEPDGKEPAEFPVAAGDAVKGIDATLQRILLKAVDLAVTRVGLRTVPMRAAGNDLPVARRFARVTVAQLAGKVDVIGRVELDVCGLTAGCQKSNPYAGWVWLSPGGRASVTIEWGSRSAGDVNVKATVRTVLEWPLWTYDTRAANDSRTVSTYVLVGGTGAGVTCPC